MKWYTVYERESEQILVSGGGAQCAKALAGKNRKYEIMIEDIEKE